VDIGDNGIHLDWFIIETKGISIEEMDLV